MSKKSIMLIAGWAVFSVWTILGWWTVIRIEKPPYSEVQRQDGYEIRTYRPYLAAQVETSGPFATALADGSDVLGRYLSGNNTTQASTESEPIAADAPIIQEFKHDAWLVSFALPESYTSMTVPRPNDARVRIVQIPSVTAAVLSWSGLVDQTTLDAYQDALAALLARDGRVVAGPPRLFRYGPSWVLPFLRTNEIVIPIQ